MTEKKKLNNKQLKAVEFLVYTDMLKQDIAKEVGVRPETISVWIKQPEFQDAIETEMQRGFKDIARKAQRKLCKLVDSDNEQVALGAVKEALNKAGYQETQKVEQQISTAINIEITGEDDK